MINLDVFLSGLDRPEPRRTPCAPVLLQRLAGVARLRPEPERSVMAAALDAAAWSRGLPPPFGSKMPDGM